MTERFEGLTLHRDSAGLNHNFRVPGHWPEDELCGSKLAPRKVPEFGLLCNGGQKLGVESNNKQCWSADTHLIRAAEMLIVKSSFHEWCISSKKVIPDSGYLYFLQVGRHFQLFLF